MLIFSIDLCNCRGGRLSRLFMIHRFLILETQDFPLIIPRFHILNSVYKSGHSTFVQFGCQR
jgi:hypothetical protein